jgi:hypothetical protein
LPFVPLHDVIPEENSNAEHIHAAGRKEEGERERGKKRRAPSDHPTFSSSQLPSPFS